MSKYSSHSELFSVFENSSLKHFEGLDSIINSPPLKHFESLGSIINSSSLKHFEALDAIINSSSLKHFEALDSIINSPSLKHFEALDSIINSSSLKHFEALDSIINSSSLKHFEALNSIINSSPLKHFEALDSIVNSSSLIHFEALNSIINSSSLKHFEVLNSVLNTKWITKCEYLNSIYTEQELSDFSDVVSEVGNNLQQGGTSVKDLQKLPSIFLLLLKYLCSYIVIPLLVSAYLEPRLIEYLQNSNEPLRVQKNTIRKLSQSSGIETTAVNRFISGDGVRLRVSSSIKSEIISYLSFGQLVYVLEKKRSWVKVAVPQKGGDSIEGWVFNEYTERFRN